jgi:hypothetical protein
MHLVLLIPAQICQEQLVFSQKGVRKDGNGLNFGVMLVLSGKKLLTTLVPLKPNISCR